MWFKLTPQHLSFLQSECQCPFTFQQECFLCCGATAENTKIEACLSKVCSP